MTLQSPLEDLKITTLRTIGGVLERLEYLSGLRNEQGQYCHWGFARVHGDIAAQQAMTEAHRSALQGLLRTPLRRLVRDLEELTEQSGVSAEQYLRSLQGRNGLLLPADSGSGSERHLSSVLHALSSLAKSQ